MKPIKMKLNQIKLTNPYLSLPPLCYDKVTPTPLKNPFIIHANSALAKELGIDPEELSTDAFLELVNGELTLEGSDAFAMCYTGHQFGFLVPRLGDGRAINIGSIGKQHLQLKGAGQTLYSRSGDGRAVLRSSIREYLMSEAMFGLGIETTRALALMGSSSRVIREDWERAAIVLRLSTSWVRFGTFEYFAHHQKYAELEALADYSIAESYPHLAGKDNCYLDFFGEVVERTARVIAKWQAVGFNHGVMNTDNMSIAGLSIDYGPYAFLDDYDEANICNHTDKKGRYSFGNQPQVAKWNLSALMQALSPLILLEDMKERLAGYDGLYSGYYVKLMREKLGLSLVEEGDVEFVRHLLAVLQKLQVDYTLFFRTLSHYDSDRTLLLRLGLYHQPMNEWLDIYDKRLELEETNSIEREQKMLQANPKYILKNYILQEVIDQAENGEYRGIEALFKIAQNPYAEHAEHERWAGVTPEAFRNNKLSCSS
ncbi:MAG: YdiU family protein [Campylobacterota bacterium]|nr:YdiU family protein [Campylobacterota bacterium]